MELSMFGAGSPIRPDARASAVPSVSQESKASDVLSFDARSEPQQLANYLTSVNDRIDNDLTRLSAASLWRPPSEKLRERNSRITVSLNGGRVVCGCYADGREDGVFEIKGLFKYPFVLSHVVKLVLAHSIADVARSRGPMVRFSTSYRVYPSGWRDGLGRVHEANLASRSVLARFGFEATPGGPISYEWTGGQHDEHLFDTLEADGKTYRNQPMASSPETAGLALDHLRGVRQ